jgi:Polyketide cyclase / dehydrase and lipid transport
VRGPLGFSRVARTRVLEAVEPRELRGRAELGRGTVGAVSWLIEPDGTGSRVTLSAEVHSAQPLDRAVLALGGAWWLRRMFAEAVEQLGRVA